MEHKQMYKDYSNDTIIPNPVYIPRKIKLLMPYPLQAQSHAVRASILGIAVILGRIVAKQTPWAGKSSKSCALMRLLGHADAWDVTG